MTMKVLIIDDDQLVADMVAAVLETSGCQANVCTSAQEGLSWLQEHPETGAVICDMNMPNMTGIELLHELRKQRNHLPFVLLTGDNPDKILAQEPALRYCIAKDGELAERLPRLIAAIRNGQ